MGASVLRRRERYGRKGDVVRPIRIVLAATAAATAALLTSTAVSAAPAPTAASSRAIYHDPSPRQVADYIAHNASRPYLGWSSWSMQSSHYPGLNPQGDYSWLTEQHVLEQGQAI